MDEQTFAVPIHPYYPWNAHIPDYVANTNSVAELLVRFAGLLILSIFTALWLATRCNPPMTAGDKAITGWYILCQCSEGIASPSFSHVQNPTDVRSSRRRLPSLFLRGYVLDV